MASTTSSPDFQSILDAAFDGYTKQTGIDLAKHPSAEELQSCQSLDAVLQLLQERENAFKDYRGGHRRLIDWLLPVVQVIHAFSGVLGEMSVMPVVPLQPTKAIFVGIDVLLMASISVTEGYDALMDLFECVGSFLSRLHVYVEKIPLSHTSAVIMVKIMVEVLSVLALATKQIKQGRFKAFARKLLREQEIEAVLRRLDRLTQDEARMTITQTLEVVHGLVNNVKVVMDDGRASTNDIRQALVTMQETVNEINKIKRDQLQRDIRSWLSPPDPSEDHNIARRYHHDGTAAWFIQGSAFKEWKTMGNLLWIHGIPGSGKSILCSSIIQEIKATCETGLALMAYFYCSFTSKAKQDIRGLLTSLIGQLCAKSDSCYDVIYDLYSRHNAGSHQPEDDALVKCFKDMLKLPGQPTIYIIVDALDECPNTGIVSPREQVLKFVKELVNLRLPNLRIGLTSRPEADIGADLALLASHAVSLHDQCGQMQDIADYVRSFVHSDRNMQGWTEEHREWVINTLLAKADGMFKWVVCQLETLRHCFPASLRDALDELPESLEETYKRILLRIDRAKREYTYRLFQCLTVSIRPLRVEELAQVLAVRFGTQNCPNYRVDCSVRDSHDAILSACSSLISIVNVDGSSVVQFSHLSVKEYLTSDRLGAAGRDLASYYIHPRLAHVTLAQASLSVLLALDKIEKESMRHFPLAIYAARYWAVHAQFDNVLTSVEEQMKRLFDPEKPYFATWVWIYDIDYPFREHMFTTQPLETQPEAVPLYYATLCGFHSLIKHLILVRPGDVNARGGYHSTPFHAALVKENRNIARLLLKHGANINALDADELSPLHRASRDGRDDVVEFLLDHGATVDVLNKYRQTPLHLASCEGELEITQVLLRRGAAVDSRSKDGWTPLMAASRYGHLNVVRFLLQNGSAVDSHNDDDWTPLTLAARNSHFDVAQQLLDHRADKRGNHEPPLDLALANQKLERLRVTDFRYHTNMTSPDTVSRNEQPNLLRLSCSHGQDPNVPDNKGKTSLHTASEEGNLGVIQSLLNRGADVNERNESHRTPLDIASREGRLEVAALLIKHRAEVNCRDKSGWTPLHKASRFGYLDIARLLLDHGADVDAQKQDRWTPLHLAAGNHYLKIAELLLERDANVYLLNNEGRTPYEVALRRDAGDIADLLLKNYSPRGV